METANSKKETMGSQNDGGNGAGEGKEVNLYDVLSPFDPETDLTGFIAAEAIKDCSEDYELLGRFLEWTDKTGVGKDELGNLTETGNVDILGEVTTPFLNVGFAVGYLFGQMFKTPDEGAGTVLAELKRR